MNITNFDYGLLFIFKICADVKSFSKASEILHVKQPAISYSIRKLEELLDVKLFDRGNYGIILTDEGKILYDYVSQANSNILSGLNILDEINKKEISEIKIGISLNLTLTYLSNTLIKFKELFPNIKIIIESKNEDEMLQRLKEKQLDIVIFNSSRNNSIQGIKIKKIKNNDIVCAGTKKYRDLFDGNNKISKEIIIPLIAPDNSTNLGKELVSKLKENNIKLETIITCHSAIIARELIKTGLGIGYISRETIKEELEQEKLYVLDDNCNVDTYSIDLAIQDKNVNVVTEQFIKLFKEKVVGNK